MNYTQSLDFIFRFSDLERSAHPVLFREFNLQRVLDLLHLVGDPHLAVPVVHVAGTKGKGSTTSMMASVLHAAGIPCGVFTSPHLHSVRERIAITGVGAITEEQFTQQVERIAPLVERLNKADRNGHLTTFEMLTAVGFLHFRDAGVRASVIEVGLGGRLDATNVVKPQVCAITNISFDHMELLGDTLALIAGEKAGIIKPGTPVVSAPQDPEAMAVIERVAAERKAPLTISGRDITWSIGEADLDGQNITVTTTRSRYSFWTRMLGDHQAENAATVVGMCERLIDQGFPITAEAVRQGMADVTWPARLEILSRNPMIVTDGAHNPYSIRKLMEAVSRRFRFRRLILVLGITKTKDVEGMIKELGTLPARVITTAAVHPRALDGETLATAVRAEGLPQESAEDTAAGIRRARELAGPDDLILVGGSLFIAAEAREIVLGVKREEHSWTPPAGVPGAP